VSLSSWIRDYVYIPLGGSRGGERRTWVNLMVAFAVSGLWHGAANNFLVWGLWHGALLVVHRAWSGAGFVLPTVLAVPATFLAVTIGWAFFSMELPRALFALARVVGSA
jgi:alginate O-acetyltransferase complex protein AlgI